MDSPSLFRPHSTFPDHQTSIGNGCNDAEDSPASQDYSCYQGNYPYHQRNADDNLVYVMPSDEINGGGGSGGSHLEAPTKNAGSRWREDETEALVEIWRDKICKTRWWKQSKGVRVNKEMWEEISQLLADHHKVFRTPSQCQIRMKNLLQFYRQTIDNRKSEKSWVELPDYFAIVDQIMTRKDHNGVSSCGSSNGSAGEKLSISENEKSHSDLEENNVDGALDQHLTETLPHKSSTTPITNDWTLTSFSTSSSTPSSSTLSSSTLLSSSPTPATTTSTTTKKASKRKFSFLSTSNGNSKQLPMNTCRDNASSRYPMVTTNITTTSGVESSQSSHNPRHVHYNPYHISSSNNINNGYYSNNIDDYSQSNTSHHHSFMKTNGHQSPPAGICPVNCCTGRYAPPPKKCCQDKHDSQHPYEVVNGGYNISSHPSKQPNTKCMEMNEKHIQHYADHDSGIIPSAKIVCQSEHRNWSPDHTMRDVNSVTTFYHNDPIQLCHKQMEMLLEIERRRLEIEEERLKEEKEANNRNGAFLLEAVKILAETFRTNNSGIKGEKID